MPRATRTITLALVIILTVGLPGPTSAWEYRLDGSDVEEFSTGDRARSVVLDSAGHVFLGGTLRNADDGSDFLLARLDPASGAPVWVDTLHGTSGAAATNSASAVALDGSGDLLAVGYMTGTDLDMAVVKVDGATGLELWRRTIDGSEIETSSSGQDFGFALALDASGNPVAAGTLQNAASGKDLVLVKLDGATGNILWQSDLDGPAGGLDQALAVIVTTGGDVIAAGMMDGVATGRDFAVVRVDGETGAPLWQRTIDQAGSTVTGLDAATSVAEDSEGHIIAAGRLLADPDTGEHLFVVARLDGATGADLWRTTVAGGAGGEYPSDSAAGASDVLVTGSGDVLAFGEILQPGPALELVLVRLNGETGAEIWRHEATGTSTSPDLATAIALDASGNVLATGALWNLDHDLDLLALKVDGATGEELWRLVRDGGGNDLDQGIDVAVDATGAAVVVGQLSSAPETGTGPFASDLAVLKLSALSGGSFVDEDGDGLDDDDPAYLADVVAALPEGVFDNMGDPEGQRNAVLARLADIQTSIAAGDLEDALQQLRNLRRRVDGCEDGPPADVNDWIVDCGAQDTVRGLIDALISALEAVSP